MTLPLYNDGLDDTPQKEEEGGFFRLNNTANPADLTPGSLTRAVNCWMETNGVLNTRPGRRLVSDTLPTTGAALAGLVYFDTPSRESVIFPAGTDLWEIISDTAPQTPVTVAAGGLPATGRKAMTQLIDRVFVANTANLMWAYWNGAAWSDGTVTKFSDGSDMPVFGLLTTHRFRVFACQANTNKIFVSKYLSAHLSDTGGDWNSLENIIVGSGNGDPTRKMISGQQADLIVLNEGSCWSVDTSAQNAVDWPVTKLTDVAGCVAGATAIMIGQDVYFLSRYGLVSLSGLVTRDSISPANTISAPVNRTIERINWTAVDNERGASSTLWRNLLLLAIPIDGATEANRVLAYNTLTKEWVGEWEWSPESALPVWGYACVTRFAGKQETLWAYPDGYITRLDDSYEDDDATGGAEEIESWVQSRAMWFGQHEAQKMPFWLEAEFHRSSSTSIAVLFVGDDEQTFPEIALESARVIEAGFNGSTFLTFPLPLPFTFSSQYTRRASWHIRNQSRFREAQIIIHSGSGQIGLRKFKMAAWLDTPVLI
jgi:hypothetical protein